MSHLPPPRPASHPIAARQRRAVAGHRRAGAGTRRAAVATLAALAASPLIVGCGGDPGPDPTSVPGASAPGGRDGRAPDGRQADDRGATGSGGHRSADAEGDRVPRATCPPELAGCRTAAGRILYIEAVDPDGDGDAHFVLASGESITAPGISVIDVARELRPRPLPRLGSWLSAAGPVHTGSFGQRQIEAVAVRTAER